MLQTLNIINYPWLQGYINDIIYDLEQNGCKVRDIRFLLSRDTSINQILFECNKVLIYKVGSLAGGIMEITIKDYDETIVLKYNEFSF